MTGRAGSGADLGLLKIDGLRVAVNRWMPEWMNWPFGWMDDCTDLREVSLLVPLFLYYM
jgi:hypothetical protein